MLQQMELPSQKSSAHFSKFFHQECIKHWLDLSHVLQNGRQFLNRFLSPVSVHQKTSFSRTLPFSSTTLESHASPSGFSNPHTITPDNVARSISGTSVYAVSNTDNEFVLISNPNDAKSIGLLFFRREDAETLLSEIRSLNGSSLGGKVVPVRLDQVYMLKVEGIAFRFMPDPLQIKNALEVRSKLPRSSNSCFNGVPVFQSDLLNVKKKGRRYCPVYFRKEDVERELLGVGSRGRRGVSHHIVVESMEDVLRKIESSGVDSGWGDVVFIPPGKSHSQYLDELEK